MEESKRPSIRINTVIIVILMAAAIIIYVRYQAALKGPGTSAKPHPPIAADIPVKPAVYSLENIKARNVQSEPIRANDMKEVYEKFPKASAGGNMVAGWAKVNPKDKENIRAAIDGDIESSRERLRQNPDDEKARQMLKISEMMNLVVTKDFNLRPGDYAPAPQRDDPARVSDDNAR